MTNTTNIYESFSKEVSGSKKKQFKRKLKDTKKKVSEWTKKNGATIARYAVAAGGLFVTVGLPIIGMVNDTRTKNRLDKQERDKKRRMYDRSLGCYVDLKRDLNKQDLTTINDRKANGERLVDILNSMNLIK